MSENILKIVRYCILPLFVWLLIGQLVIIFFRGMPFDSINLITSVCSFIVLYFGFFRGFHRKVRQEQQDIGIHKTSKVMFVLCVILGITVCISLNNLVAVFQLDKTIPTYDKVAERIYTGDFLVVSLYVIVFAVCVEEILFRGLIYRQLVTITGRRRAAILSALAFALLHGNLLQGLYAFCIGILLVYAYETYQSMAAPLVVHMSANAISILLTKTPLAKSLYRSEQGFFVLTAIAAVTVLVCLFLMTLWVKPKVYHKIK